MKESKPTAPDLTGYTWKKLQELFFRQKLEQSDGHVADTAKSMGVSQRTAYRWLSQYCEGENSRDVVNMANRNNGDCSGVANTTETTRQ